MFVYTALEKRGLSRLGTFKFSQTTNFKAWSIQTLFQVSLTQSAGGREFNSGPSFRCSCMFVCTALEKRGPSRPGASKISQARDLMPEGSRLCFGIARFFDACASFKLGKSGLSWFWGWQPQEWLNLCELGRGLIAICADIMSTLRS